LWAELESVTTWVNMADVIDYLFKDTSMASMPRTFWDMACCGTFFINTQLLWQRSIQDYETYIRHINELASNGFCSVFTDWPACSLPEEQFNAKWRKDPRMTDNFHVSQVVEKIWGVVLANRQRGNWKHINFTGDD